MREKKDKLFYRYYDIIFAKKKYAAETNTALRFSKQFGIFPPQNTLEIGCGTGNHTLYLAKKIKKVTAIDTDAIMVRKAKEKIALARVKNITILHTGIEKMKVGAFDLIVALFNVVTYIPDTMSLHSFMQAVADHLRPGGIFIFDCWNGVAALRNPPGSKKTVIKYGGEKITTILTSKTDLFNQKTVLNYHIVVKNGSRQKDDFSFSQTLWTPVQIRVAIENVGLKKLLCCPLMSFRKVATENDWKIMFVCKK
ncbi:MAG: class I SAM-dependent methyltransferase [Candidatus Levybacteria bacterium]|nr:class I SAM-dependent methyltransferase [Candidatus Levybacteria bacterium]